MSPEHEPPPIPSPPLPPGQWAYPVDAQGNPKKKYLLWLAVGAAGCFGLLILIGLAATILVPQLIRRMGRARDAAQHTMVLSQLQELRSALNEYAYAHDDRYPESLDALDLPEKPMKDPWGRPYLYEPPSAEHRKGRLSTLGRDGKPGGSGPDEDVFDGS